MNIEGKVVLITGSAKRIGRATAVEMARKGARVGIHYRSSKREAEHTLELIRDSGGDAALFRGELTDTAILSGIFQQLNSRFGGLDILVNNASIFSAATADQTTPEQWDEQMGTNAKAPFLVAQHAAPLMRLRGQGKIINIVDVAGESVWTRYFPYSISKAALIAVNQGLAKSWAPHIQVNAIAPGPVLFPEAYTEEQKHAAIERTLLKRQGSPQDVINAILFFIENDYITGELIHVDGGRHLV